MGESAADWLAEGLGLGNWTALLMFAILVGTSALQMLHSKYVPLIYWLNVIMVSIVGTLITDLLVDELGTPEWACILAFFILMCGTFGMWYYQEQTLSIHSINTLKREGYYWLAILFTFALGTAVGDGLAEKAELGYWQALLVFAAMIGVIAILYYVNVLGEISSFWLVYILTRPLGASLGDFLSQCPVVVGVPLDDDAGEVPDFNPGGLCLGPGVTSGIFLSCIAICIIYLWWSKVDVPSKDLEEAALAEELEAHRVKAMENGQTKTADHDGSEVKKIEDEPEE